MNIEKTKISEIQLIFIIAAFMQGSVFLLSYPIPMTKQTTWLALLCSFAFMIPIVYSYCTLMKWFPEMNIIQINDYVFGKYLGKIISLYFILYFLISLTLNISDIGSLFSTYFMTDTPVLLFFIVFSLSCAFALYKGLEIVAHVSHLFYIVGVTIIVSTLILLLVEMDFSNFLPLFDVSPIQFFHGIQTYAILPLEILPFLVIFNTVTKKESLTKSTFIGYLLGVFSFLLVIIRNTGVMGNSRIIYTSSSFETIKMIDIADIFSRMDILIAIGNTMSLFFKCCIFYYAAVVSISQFLNLKSFKPLILPIGLFVIFFTGVITKSTIEQYEYVMNTFIFYPIPIMFIIPPLALLVAKIRGLKLQSSKDG